MSLSTEKLAKALKVDTTISEEDEEYVDKSWKPKWYYASRDMVYNELIEKRILERIEQLVEKVDKL